MKPSFAHILQAITTGSGGKFAIIIAARVGTLALFQNQVNYSRAQTLSHMIKTR